ncbi:MAG: homoserine O-acetyltransferase [Trueperaceae bacterium]|nr:homoserine O-acetyltransferase [Trueperaceae bacterium]
MLVHETWGDHEALLARSQNDTAGSVGVVSSQVMTVATPDDPLELDYGGRLDHVEVAFETYGELNAAGDNAVVVCHALTGSAHAAGVHAPGEVPGWWDPLIGPGKPIDTRRFFVISSNVLGGCYGTTGPSSPNPATGNLYRLDFPRCTIRDMVHVQKRLVDRLGVTSVASVIGGSMGGMQILEWAALYPDLIRSFVPVSIGARHSAWAIGLNEVARRAITADPTWQGGDYLPGQQPEAGLGLARAIAMLSYRSSESLEAKFGRERVGPSRDLLSQTFEIQSYLNYQGVKLVKRFDANSYLYITRAMDDYDLAEGRGHLAAVLNKMSMPALVMGINSDVLYPEAEQRALAEGLPNADYVRINSPHGHDAFLIEFPQVAVRLRRFLERSG